MKVLITGGTGFVGSALARQLLAEGHQVTLLGSRSQAGRTDNPALTRLAADTSRAGDWQRVVAEQDVLVNLAGRSIFHLWTAGYKRQIRDSRILTTRNLVDALPEGSGAVLLSTSAAGFYGDGGDHEKTEAAEPGSGFLAEVCREWEAEAKKAERKGTRVAVMRFGVVLGAGGALATMKRPFSLGLGGPIGNGRQWFPWIHIDDLVQAALFLLRNGLGGCYNFTAPGLIRQKEFADALGEALGKPAILPVPALLMRLALGEFGLSLLQGQRATPRALLKNGFSFRYPEIKPALQEIVRA